MATRRIGIIGGSGLYEMKEITVKDRIFLDTPYGAPSDAFILGELGGREVVFLPRHGRGHRLLPSEINYRANLWGMKKLGVEWLISVSAVGSLREEIEPLDFVLVDQFVDRTTRRLQTFFGDGVVAHVSLAHPVCPELSRIVYEAGQECGEGASIHWGGTYVNIEGPAFSTKAESELYRSWGMDVIGMTNFPEARLAREAEICFATIATVTDYDCWNEKSTEGEVNVEMVIANLNRNVERVKRILKQAILTLPKTRVCGCPHALRNAIMTRADLIPEGTKKRLELIIGNYLK